MASRLAGWMEGLRSDLRLACRQLGKAPGFAVVVVLMMAAGIGVSTAIFSIVRNVLLRPLPYRDPGRLVQLVTMSRKTGEQGRWTAPLRDAYDWKTMAPAFRDVAGYRYSLLNLRSGGQVETLYGSAVEANVLPMLGVRPQLGQWFAEGSDWPGAAHQVILSDDMWRREFNADPRIVGKTLQMDNEGYLVLGVMPRGFNFPLRLATSAALPTDQMQYWVPLGLDVAHLPHGDASSGVIARLKDGVTLDQAQEQLQAACLRLEEQYPATNKDLSAVVRSLRQQTVLPVNAPLLALFWAAALVALLTCANIASLLLARGESRAGELAVRMALGGGYWQVARLPLLQGVVVCACGCVLGVPLAMGVLKLLLRLSPIDVPRLANSNIDGRALLFAAGLALLSSIFVGGFNALQVLRRSPQEVLAGSARGYVGQPRTRLRSSMAVIQIALAVVLVSGAGLMLRTFRNLLSADTGYHASHVYYGVTVLRHSRYPQFEQQELFFQKLLNELRAAPGVEAAAVSTGMPFVRQYDGASFEARESARGERGSQLVGDSNSVSPEYMEMMGVKLLAGRLIRESDTADSPKVVVVDQTLANALWPGQSAIGHFLNVDDPAKPVWRQVVGIIAPTRNHSLDEAAFPGVFLPLAQTTGYANFVVVKSHASTAQVAQLLRSAVARLDADQGVFFVQSFSGLIEDTVAVRRFLFIVLAFFGAAALLLAALGIYGLISFIALSRTREVGIRMALGATRADIGKLVVAQGIRLTVMGVAAGVLAFALLGRLLSGLLFGVLSFDAATIAFAAATLGSAAAIAALIPAWRSTRVQPIAALRTE
ncbi:MAG: ADOP family duplicated permease [Terracidiphilus sp.]